MYMSDACLACAQVCVFVSHLMFYVHPGTLKTWLAVPACFALLFFFANVKNITKNISETSGNCARRNKKKKEPGSKGEGIWAPWKVNANDCRKSLLLLLGLGSLGNNLGMLLFCVRPK